MFEQENIEKPQLHCSINRRNNRVANSYTLVCSCTYKGRSRMIRSKFSSSKTNSDLLNDDASLSDEFGMFLNEVGDDWYLSDSVLTCRFRTEPFKSNTYKIKAI